MKHEPITNGEDIVCLIDGKIWPHVWPGRKVHKKLKVWLIGNVFVEQYENRLQPFTLHKNGHVIKFCESLEEVHRIIRYENF